MKNRSEYKTKQRELILTCLQENQSQHITAEKIVEILKTRGESIGFTTVYRNLDKLVKDGVVFKFHVSEGMSACYQYAERSGECQNHYHLVCVGCGEMIHLQCAFFDTLSSHIQDEHQFRLDHFKTVLYGRCKSCDASHWPNKTPAQKDIAAHSPNLP